MADAVRYLGIDLAWSGSAPSGVSATDASGRAISDGALPPDRLADWIREHRGERSVLAVDAPLLFRATTPTLRPAERALHRLYGRYHAGPFPGGPGSTAMRGRQTSPALELLAAVSGYSVDPTDRDAAHRAIEVFPGPAWITLGGRNERIRYKRGTLAERIDGLGTARDVLRTAIGPDATLGASLEASWQRARTGRDWKSVEDILDARLCAHIALLWDTQGTDEWVVAGEGDWADGCIVVPPPRRGATRYDADMIDLVLTLIGPDHPGIVDSVSEAVAAHGGNWLESRMVHLAGKFAGVLCVEVADEQAAALEDALGRLEVSGLKVVVERSAPAEAARQHAVDIELLGLDRPGLVHEISTLLAAHRINVEELATDRTAAAHSGDRMFQAHIRVVIPEGVDVSAVRGDLERLAGDLMVEIRLAEALGAAR
jgi:glycine cleavage system regulatory protein/predicted RNase H-like nuclease